MTAPITKSLRVRAVAAIPAARRHRQTGARLRRDWLRWSRTIGKVTEDWARRGFTGVKAKIGYATAAGRHLWPEISAQLLSVTPTADWLEYADWWNSIVAQPLAIKDGMRQFGSATGTGIEWDEQAVNSCWCDWRA